MKKALLKGINFSQDRLTKQTESRLITLLLSSELQESFYTDSSQPFTMWDSASLRIMPRKRLSFFLIKRLSIPRDRDLLRTLLEEVPAEPKLRAL